VRTFFGAIINSLGAGDDGGREPPADGAAARSGLGALEQPMSSSPDDAATTEDHGSDRAVPMSAELLNELLEYASDIIMVTTVDNLVAYASPSIERMVGMTPDEVVGRLAEELIHPDDYEALYTEAANQLLLGTEPRPIVFRQRCADGSYLHVEASVGALPDGHPLGVAIINARDVSDRVAAEQAHAAAEQAHHESQHVIQMVAEGQSFDDIVNAVTALAERRAPGCVATVSVVDERRQVITLAGAPSLPEPLLTRLRERPLEMGMGTCIEAVLRDRRIVTEDMATDSGWSYLTDEAIDDGLRACWATPIHSSQGNAIIGTFAMYWPAPTELTSELGEVMDEAARLATIALGRARIEAELAHRATHDPLTGLPNRSLLYDRMEQALARHRRSATDDVAAMFVDLDHFKEVNDQLGHSVGDELLRQAAQRLRSTVREVDTIARFGGDEFIVLAHTNDLATLACRLNEAMTAIFPIGEGIHVSCSIGVAKVLDGDTPDTLIHRADQALYHAKEHGRNCFATFDDPASQGIKLAELDAMSSRRRTLR
jgi:diguanylate cyclase (GGDEF)-like protein/PAS domain S-box-containing protein